ncbi:MAG: hypothetical protein ACRCT2_07765, partial [Plesiomonas shigelloides]
MKYCQSYCQNIVNQILSILACFISESNTAFCPLSSMLANLVKRSHAGPKDPLFATQEGSLFPGAGSPPTFVCFANIAGFLQTAVLHIRC